MAKNLVVTVGTAPAHSERTLEIEALPAAGGGSRLRLVTDGKARTLDVFRHEGGVVTVRDPDTDRIYTLELEGVMPSFTVTLGDQVVPTKVESARSRALRALGQREGATSGPTTVSTPMPGRVVKILVASGTAVSAGQSLLVIEAMKMENEVRAPRDGQITELRVREGQAVEASETLLVIG